MPQFGQITPAQTFRLVGTPDAPVIFDVRIAEDIAALPRLIPGARLLPHDQIATLTDPPGRAIAVCTKGKKLSEGAAAWLRSMGWQAESLEGGTLAWEAAGLPMLPLSALPAPGTPWVTRHRPKLRRSACPCLIRRSSMAHVGWDGPKGYAWDALTGNGLLDRDTRRAADLRAVVNGVYSERPDGDILSNGPIPDG